MIIDKSNLFLSLKSVSTNESGSNFEEVSLNGGGGGDSNTTPVNELEQ
jgi:hypothetical protein